MRHDENSLRARRTMAFAFALLCALGLSAACRPRGESNTAANSNTTRKQFTETEVVEIRNLLNGVDPSRYRVTLPAFREGRQVGSQTLGNLSVAEVERIASVRGIRFDERTPLLGFVMDDPDEKGSAAGIAASSSTSTGGSGGSAPPTGGGSAGIAASSSTSTGGSGGSSPPPAGGGEAGITPSSAEAEGRLRDRISRIELILSRLDKSEYVLIR